MAFVDYSFIVFFVIVFSFYWLVRRTGWQNVLLLIASYIFYTWGQMEYALLLLFSTILDYYLGRGMASCEKSKKKGYLILSLVLNIGILAFYKYAPSINLVWETETNAFLAGIIFPLGLSFYTFKKISYAIDVYRGEIPAEEKFVSYALYVAFFPQISAGPIDRPKNLLTQIRKTRQWSWNNLWASYPLLITGLFKKLVVADNISPLVTRIFMLQMPSKALVVVGLLGFGVQLLADFSAYTDLARGLSFLLGFNTPENFNHPYFALTPTDFWNRWHITLSTWLRDYIFFPLRRYLLRHWRNISGLDWVLPPIVTMLVSGIWHGNTWNYVLWGGYWGLLIVLYQKFGFGGNWKPRNVVERLAMWGVMAIFIQLGWFIFRSPSLDWMWTVVAYAPWANAQDSISSLVCLSLCIGYTIPLVFLYVIEKLGQKYPLIVPVGLALMAVLAIVCSNAGTPDFIYARF